LRFLVYFLMLAGALVFFKEFFAFVNKPLVYIKDYLFEDKQNARKPADQFLQKNFLQVLCLMYGSLGSFIMYLLFPGWHPWLTLVLYITSIFLLFCYVVYYKYRKSPSVCESSTQSSTNKAFPKSPRRGINIRIVNDLTYKVLFTSFYRVRQCGLQTVYYTRSNFSP